MTEMFAQLTGPSMATGVTSVLHPSPNAASLGKFQEIPVSRHTGIPSINIPLWQINQGDIAIGIGLNYHSGGIRVDEIASWVGTGWALSGAGMVTRSTRGLPDDLERFRQFDQPRINRFHDRQSPNAMNNKERQDFILGIYRGLYDGEPDMYNVSVGDFSCRFFMGSDGEFVAAPRDPTLKIQYKVRESINGISTLYTWVITDGKGLRYKFSGAENTTSSMFTQGQDGIRTDAGEFTGETAWVIAEIEDVKGNRVQFGYEGEFNRYSNVTSEFASVPKNADVRCQFAQSYSYADNNSGTLRLSNIRCGQEEMRFTTSPTGRLDLSGSRALQTIEVRYAGQVRKRFQLFMGYASTSRIGMQGMSFTQEPYRLRLDSVREESGDSRIFLPAYRFTYDQNQLPSRNSAAQDHWGFYNGQNNTSRVSYTINDRRAGAKKDPNPQFSIAGVLTQIRYPTGGTTTFEYEGNTYANSTPFITKDTAVVSLIGHNTITLNNPNKYQTDFMYSVDFEVTPRMAGPTGRMPFIPTYVSREICGAVSPPWSGGFISLFLRNIRTNQFIYFSDNGQILVDKKFVQLELTPGQYQLIGNIQSEFPNDPEAPNPNNINYYIGFQMAISTRMIIPSGQYNAPGPGIRIKSIERKYSPTNYVRTIYDYTDPATGFTSGIIGSFPEYSINKIYYRTSQLSPELPPDKYQCDCDDFISNSRYPLINTKSSFIGYNYVTEKTVDSGQSNGKKTFEYTNYDFYNDINNAPGFPYPPNSPQDWKRGLPLTEKTWSNATNTSTSSFLIQKRDSSTYGILSGSLYRTYGIKVGCKVDISRSPFMIDEFLYSNIIVDEYPIESDSYQLWNKFSTQYADGKSYENFTAYGYSTIGLLRKILTRNSDGSTTMQRFNYPLDYQANISKSNILTDLLDANIVSLPIEQTTVRNSVNGTSLVSGTVHEYKKLASAISTRYFLHKIHSARTQQTDTTSRYNFITLPTYYDEKVTIPSVNGRGYPLGHLESKQNLISYQWGYDDRYVVAKCVNAAKNEFYYEGFEEINTATTGAAHSGLHYLAGSYSVTWIRPNSKNYVLSYWARQNGNWRHVHTPYNGPVTLTDGDAYDDIQIRPIDALLTAYTYDPLVGMTSQTDPSGRTIFYEYDALGRLLRVRDEQNRVLSENEYKYARP